MRPGTANNRIRIEKRSTVQDTAGEPALTWTLVAECWASRDKTPGHEIWVSAQRNARVPTIFRTWWRDGILPSMRLLEKDTVYDVKSVFDADGRRRELVLVCEELVGQTP